MRIKPVFYILGKVLLVLGMAMIAPLLVALYYGDDIGPFLYTVPITCVAAGILLYCSREGRNIPLRQREGFLFVTLVWVMAAFFGALPYWFAQVFNNSFADALFESMSGFTTTGATSLMHIEDLPPGLLFWRALTHWLGGAGIVLLFVAFLRGRDGSGSGVQILNAEHSGGDLAEKLMPRVSDTAKALCLVYVGLTLAETLLLLLGGMDIFDAVTHTFGTVSTGGFSTKNDSIAYYNSAFIEWVIIAFMFLSSINLAFYYLLIARKKPRLFRDEEARTFAIICVVATLLLTASLSMRGFYAGQGLQHTIREAAFQTVSVISTTGYATANYGIWPPFSRYLLFLLMFVGGCIGSTASSIKVSRVIVVFKACRNELWGMAHPHMVKKLYFNKKIIGQNTVTHILFYIIAFFALTLTAALALTISGINPSQALTASLACISNVGPGLIDSVDYADLNILAKCMLIFNMLAGRLEIFTVAVLFLPSVWKK